MAATSGLVEIALSLYAGDRSHRRTTPSVYAPEQARDLTQDFFAYLLERDVIARADPARGRFRAFLRTVCARNLADRFRDKLHAAHPNASGLFDLKHDRGGMIDIEFAVQYLVLANAQRYRDLTGNLGNIALLQMAAGHGLIDAGLAERCREAYREFRRLQHGLRLKGAQYARVPRAEVQTHFDAVSALWQTVLRPAS